MQNYCKTIGAMAAASALVAGTASAEVEYELHTGYTSEYLFRGSDLGNDLTEVGLNAATTYNDINFSAGVWAAAFNTSGTGNEVDNEVDFSAEVSKDLGFATLGLGYIYYWNMGLLGDDTQEVYFTASRDFGFAEAYVTYFWDVDGDNDGYAEFGFSRGWEINQCLTLNVLTNCGYFFEGHEFGSWTTKVGLDWAFVETAKLTPFVAFALDLQDKPGLDDELVAGTMLTVSF